MDFFDVLSEKKLFIFDLDGTATDTEPFHYEAYRQTVEEFCPGHTVTKEEFLQNYVGHPETEIYSLLKKNKNVAFDDGEFFRKSWDCGLRPSTVSLKFCTPTQSLSPLPVKGSPCLSAFALLSITEK